MIAKVTSGSDFGGLARYLTYREDRVGFVELHNMASRDVREAAREMQITSELSSRCKKPVYHLSLSFDPGDQPSEEQLRSAASRVLKELNLDTHQAVVVSHRDTAHPHVHVMVNRVHAETGKAWRTSHDWRRIERALRKLEKEWSLREVPGRHNPSKEMPERRVSAFTQELRDKAGVALHKAESWAEYRAVLDHHDLEMRLRPRGLVLSDGRAYASAGRVSESLPALNQRFGETLQENRSRLVDARMMPLAGSQRNPDIILHSVTDGRTDALNALLQHADAASVRRAVKWAKNQLHRASLESVRLQRPQVQDFVREARQDARVWRQVEEYQRVAALHQQEQHALSAYHNAQKEAREMDAAFRCSLESWYVDPDRVRTAFYRMAEQRGADTACMQMERNSGRFGRRRWRGRFQQPADAARQGYWAARALQAVPDTPHQTSGLEARENLLYRCRPSDPSRSRVELGATLTNLSPVEIRLVRKVLGKTIIQNLNISREVFLRRERENDADMGL